jgi:hypothetical protein
MPNSKEAASNIFVPEDRKCMTAGLELGRPIDNQVQVRRVECCKQEQYRSINQSNTINDDDLDNTEAPTAGEHVTADG